MNGNIQNSTETLKAQLKSISYGKIPLFNDFVAYNPGIFLQILHYVVVDYSPLVYGYLDQKGYSLYATNDLRFIEEVYKILIQEFAIKPKINVKQFLSESFLESKINFCITLITTIKNLDSKLASESKPKPKLPVKAKSSIGTTKDPLVRKSIEKENKINAFSNESEKLPKKDKFSMLEEHEAFDEMEIPVPMSLNKDLEIPQIEEFTPKSKTPIEPESLSHFAFYENKENSQNYMNQEPLEPKRSVSENQTSKSIGENKKEEKANNQQTKEILKMIVEMNNAFLLLNKKFESFQNNVEGWMKNTNAQMLLMETNFTVLKAQLNSKNANKSLTGDE